MRGSRAREFERILRDWTAKPTWNLEEEYRLGRIPKVFFESDDPNRMVPLVWEPDDYMIVVTGDPARNSVVRVRAQRRAGLSGHEEDRLGARAGRPAGQRGKAHMSLRRRRDIWDVVVVGGGIGGLTAAWYTARRGLPTAVLEAQGLLGGQVATVNTLDDWPATGDVSGVELARAMSEKLRNNAVEIKHEAAIEVRRSGDTGLLLVRTEGETLRARRVIAASGARLRALDVAGADAFVGKGISQCAHCDGYFFKGQDVVVVGGGDSALQEALVLAPLARTVTIVVRSRLRAKQAYVERAASAANVRWVWDSEVDAVARKRRADGREAAQRENRCRPPRWRARGCFRSSASSRIPASCRPRSAETRRAASSRTIECGRLNPRSSRSARCAPAFREN